LRLLSPPTDFVDASMDLTFIFDHCVRRKERRKRFVVV
jgi:hypothetical protein